MLGELGHEIAKGYCVQHLHLVDAVNRVVAKFLFDAEELVVFRDPVRAAHRAGLDLAAVGGDGDVGDGAVLGLAGAVAEHGGVGVFLRHFHGVEGLGERADLVDLDEDGVGHAELDALGEELGVGDEEVVADELGGLAELVGEDFPAGPVVFVAAVFDGDDGVFLLKLRVVLDDFFGGFDGLVGLLEDVVVLLLVEELGAGDVERDGDLGRRPCSRLSRWPGRSRRARRRRSSASERSRLRHRRRW